MKFTALHSCSSLFQLLSTIFLLGLIWCCPKNSFGQNYYIQANNQVQYLTQDFSCDTCTFNSLVEGVPLGYGGLSFGPDGSLYVLSGAPENSIHKIDITTFEVTLVYSDPYNVVQMGGFLAMGGGIFYSIASIAESNDSLFLWDTNADTMYAVGELPYKPYGEMWMANGKVYYLSWQNSPRRIVEIDLNFPEESEIALEFSPDYIIYALTATPVANLMMGIETSFFSPGRHLVSVNMIDGTVSPYCRMPKASTHGLLRAITSQYEHAEVPPLLQIDLDCDNSSGATGDNFNGISVNCFSEDGAPVTDDDIKMFIDARITTMAITVSNPLDDPDEVFTVTGPLNGIVADGEGTSMLTLINEGEAKISDFQEALKLVRYHNLNLSPTGGLREIEVFFETESGNTCETAIAFIYVEEKDQIELDLGPDVMELCEGSTIVLDPGLTQVQYLWSTGETSSTIEVTDGGTYSLTVSGGIDCPNSDEVEIILLPEYVITLDGDSTLCSGEDITLIVNTDAPFEIDIEISAEPGDATWYYGISSGFIISDTPVGPTDYFISTIIPEEPACFNIDEAYQVVEIQSNLSFSDSLSICEGDSILLGTTWQSLPGDYTVIHPSSQGCDTVFTHTLSLNPIAQLTFHQHTCDSSAAGQSVSWLMNPSGCDTMVTTFVDWIGPDTTQLTLTTCSQSAVSIVTDTLSNVYGCDSILITTTSWTPPLDTTFLFSTSCDTSQQGVHSLFLQGASGCDSLVIENITPGRPDTSYTNATSCNPGDVGVFVEHLLSSGQCDSTIIRTITFAERDSVFISGASCDPDDIGVFVSTYTNQFGCDSVVTQTIQLQPSSETFLQGTTCDPGSAGVFITTLTNQHGCDSIIQQTITLLPHDEVFLSSSTCQSSNAGIFVTTLTNQHGCDSIITETVTLVSADTTTFLSYTCDASQVETIASLYTGHDGCDSLVQQVIALHSLPVLQLQITSDYNGYPVSCKDAEDGVINGLAQGVQPFTYDWSTGDHDPLLTNLSVGNYSLTVTDGNGCTTEGSIVLTEPELVEVALEITEPTCFENLVGSIEVIPHGGVSPHTYSINGGASQTSPLFEGLGEGVYQVAVFDANDCSNTEIIAINIPLSIDVELGEDHFISLGDSVQIEAVINLPFDSIASLSWSGNGQVNCPECLTQIVAPVITTAYSVSVTSADGCSDRDSVTIQIKSDSEMYVPNIFSPNGDGINDYFTIALGDDVERISSLSIFDRWGTLLYGVESIFPSDPSLAWDGKFNGQSLNPGVFTYKLILIFKDGQRAVHYGDITLIR